ncbi:PAS domain-containing sensor histidine kinase [Desulfobacula sp.]|uniref:hybrid sensor histidine kinase/response regulator n=1 Tax=Desulfobacula sp. TaxID=2593537 RepID=UPI002607AC21|nr:PAS domain-containing sensor histidine kinase [Desulfobacula sp.]
MLGDLIAQNIPLGVVLTQDGNICHMNEWAYKFTGYSATEVEKKSFFELIHPEDHEKIITRQNDIMTGQYHSKKLRYRIIGKKGDIFWIRIRSRIVEYCGKPALISFLIDETQNKVHEESLKKSEERYRELVENLAEGIVVVRDSKICFINKTLRNKLGLTLESIVETSFLDFIHLDDMANVLDRYQRRIKGEKISDAYEVRLVKPDGEEIICEIRSSLISWEGKPATQTAILDIADRKKAEKEKKQLEKRLVHMEKMEALGLLAGGVAHDLNNVLSGIVSYPEILLMSLPKDHRLRRPLDLIHTSGLKASAIVSDLLTLARRGVMATEVINLNNIIVDYLKSPEHHKLLLYYTNIRIETNLAQNLININGSEIHLRTTIMNLVSNAAEAQPSGGEIIISTWNQHIDKPIQGYESIKEGEFVVVTIEDKGIGIDGKDLQRIFEPFYTKKIMGRSGTGLGMAVVWGTVQDHYGYINIESIQNKGTKFYLYFPIVRQQIVKKNEPVPIEEYMGNQETILIVDDIKEQRQIVKTILTRLNYTVETASSGEEAVEYLKNYSYDLLLLDMIMDPGIDGLETYRRIIKLKPGQKVVIVSGFLESERIKEAQKLGAGQYIKKPYSVEKIGLVIKEELGK